VVDPVLDLGEPEPQPCPNSQWPDDGSEVLEFVGQPSVEQWDETGFPGIYYSYLSEQSPSPGQPALALSSDTDGASIFNFGATIDEMSAVPWRGQRVRMRSQVALAGVEGNANLWLRIDTGPGVSSNIDNGSDQPDFGTSDDWETHEIVVDVPEDATSLVFGSLISGPGTYVVTSPVFETVTQAVPTTSPNERPPRDAVQCAEPTDQYVQKILHHTRPDSWKPAAALAWPEEISRDEDMLYDQTPTLRISGDVATSIEGGILWVGLKAGRRLRLSLPVRVADFSGSVSLVFRTLSGEELVSRQTQALPVTDEFQHFTVVADLPKDPTATARIGIVVEGSGTVWAGYGTIEQVTKDVPLSPLVER